MIATPGRLLDHFVTTTSFDISQVEMLILDEADQLLDLGFEKDLRQIISTLDARRRDKNRRRQTVLTSATLTDKVRHKISKYIQVQVCHIEKKIYIRKLLIYCRFISGHFVLFYRLLSLRKYSVTRNEPVF